MEQQLKEFVHAWDTAMETNNAEDIGSYMTDDWVCVGGTGINTKQAFLSWIARGDLVHTRMDSDEMHVKVYGYTGIITSKGTSAGTYKGQPFELYEWSTSVCIFGDDGWKCVHTMLTEVKRD